MSDTTKSIRRPTVTLQLPKSVPTLIVYAQGIVKRMTANPFFANPSPALAAVTSAVDDLQTAETAALARTKGTAATRNAKRTALVALLQQLRAYIQTTADANRPWPHPSSRAPASPCARPPRVARASSPRRRARSPERRRSPPRRRPNAPRTNGSTAPTVARRGSPRRPPFNPKHPLPASRPERPCSSSTGP